jgi:hypothetical protein
LALFACNHVYCYSAAAAAAATAAAAGCSLAEYVPYDSDYVDTTSDESFRLVGTCMT